MTAPVSVVTDAIRSRVSGGSPSVTVSTRFARLWPVNDTGGSVTAAPPALVSEPVRATESSHSAGLVPSPVAGKCCASAHESTGTYALPLRCSAVIVFSRTVDQNVGPVYWQAEPAVQFRAYGTSGQFAASALFSGSHVPDTHRSAGVNTTWSGAAAA